MTRPDPPHLLVVGFPDSSDARDQVSNRESWADRMSEDGYRVRTLRAGPGRASRLANVARVVASGWWADAIVVVTNSGRRFWTTFLVVRMARVRSRPSIVELDGDDLLQFVRHHPRRAESTLRMATRVVTSSRSLHRQFREPGFLVDVHPDLLAGPEPDTCGDPDEGVVYWERALNLCGIRRRPTPRNGCDALGLRNLDEIVEIHRAAFPESAITQLGPSVVRRYYLGQFVGPHPVPVALGVWNEGELVGFLFGGIRRRAVVGFVRRYAGAIACGMARHPGAVRRLAAPAVVGVARSLARGERGTRSDSRHDAVRPKPAAPVPESSFGVLSVAVRPSIQGTGAAGMLMEQAERTASAQEFTRMHLTVQTANARAIAFYERQGWVRQHETNEWQGAMMKSIANARRQSVSERP